MALFFECMLQCARKLLDTADIVREAMFHQLTEPDFIGAAFFAEQRASLSIPSLASLLPQFLSRSSWG